MQYLGNGIQDGKLQIQCGQRRTTRYCTYSSKYTTFGDDRLVTHLQLDIFGIAAGHLPASAPFSLSLSTIAPPPSPQDLQFSNETLNVAIHNRQAFEELYVALTNRAVDFYAKSGRRKFALKLHGFLAAFEL